MPDDVGFWWFEIWYGEVLERIDFKDVYSILQERLSGKSAGPHKVSNGDSPEIQHLSRAIAPLLLRLFTDHYKLLVRYSTWWGGEANAAAHSTMIHAQHWAETCAVMPQLLERSDGFSPSHMNPLRDTRSWQLHFPVHAGLQAHQEVQCSADKFTTSEAADDMKSALRTSSPQAADLLGLEPLIHHLVALCIHPNPNDRSEIWKSSCFHPSSFLQHHKTHFWSFLIFFPSFSLGHRWQHGDESNPFWDAKSRSTEDMSTSFHATGSFSWMAPEARLGFAPRNGPVSA